MSEKTTEWVRKIPELIRQIRQNKGLSQENLADALGISTSAYGDLERGKTEITISRLALIAHTLEVPFTTLLGIDEGPHTERLIEENNRLNREIMALVFRNELLENRLEAILASQKERQRIGF